MCLFLQLSTSSSVSSNSCSRSRCSANSTYSRSVSFSISMAIDDVRPRLKELSRPSISRTMRLISYPEARRHVFEQYVGGRPAPGGGFGSGLWHFGHNVVMNFSRNGFCRNLRQLKLETPG